MVSIDLEERVGVATPPRWNLQIRVDQIDVYDSQDLPELLIEVAKSIMNGVTKWSNDQIGRR
jgi:hypothetical protein